MGTTASDGHWGGSPIEWRANNLLSARTREKEREREEENKERRGTEWVQ